MAGDSEQTLQNHQQPNGGEPFLIGVSGGTASGKVWRGPGALFPSPSPSQAWARRRRRMWPAAAGRVSCCSHRVARAPPLLAALQRWVLTARIPGAASGDGRVGTRDI